MLERIIRLFRDRRQPAGRGLLNRLVRDHRANTLAIMAISMIPIAGMLGSALDLSRGYLVKTRLQQACDAGVLAARKAMDGNVIKQTDRDRADQFFKANWKDGTLGTASTSFSIANGSPVDIIAGTSSTVMPMTVMKMFGFANVTLEAKCESRLDLTNTDVVFVLDVTGSMSCLTSDSLNTCNTYAVTNAVSDSKGRYITEKTNSRIAGLRAAVLDFYDTLDEAKTPGTRIRYAFVPYSTTVNVGALIRGVNSGFIRNTAPYQSRRVDYWWRKTVLSTAQKSKASDCTGAVARSPATGFPAEQTFAVYNPDGNDLPGTQTQTNKNCRLIKIEYRSGSLAQPSGFSPRWAYEQRTIDVSQYKLGNAVWDDTVAPQVQRTWPGCIEEVNTTQNWTSGTLPQDLNVNLSANDITSDAVRWRPQRPEVIYDDDYLGDTPTAYPWDPGSIFQPSSYPNADACPKAATRLAEMTRDAVDDYLEPSSGFRPYGMTYHDIGLIWGGRLLSTTGIFAADNTDAANTSRNIVFLTDGAMQPQDIAASAYGYERLDHRVSSSTSNLTARHNARFTAVCNNLPANVNVWVVAFSQSLTTELTNCADSGRSFTATDTATLQTQFREIAGRIAGLRLNK